MQLINVLFRSKQPLDIYRSIKGRMGIPHPARRNPNGRGEVSKTLAKSVLAALAMDIVHGAEAGRTPNGDVVVAIDTATRGPAAVAYDADWRLKGVYAPDGLSYVATYHIPMVVMAEALARPEEAADFLEAFRELLAYYESVGRLDLGDLCGDERFRTLALTAADELYYWLRYGPEEADRANDRVGTDGAVETGFASELTWQRQAELPFHAFADAKAMDGVLRGQSGGAPAAPATLWPAVQGATFVGVQLAQTVHALRRGRNVLAVGPTGSGKTHAFAEALDALNLDHEKAKGSEGMLDLDFLGAIVPVEGGDRVWVDGPLARAFRRAAGTRVAFWLDEATRVPTRMLNVLVGAMDPETFEGLALRGVLPDGVSPSGAFYTVEVPGTSEMLTCPVENLTFMLSANVGRQYAVHGLDPALARRCHYQLDFSYLPEAEERKLVAGRIGQPAQALIPAVVAAVAARAREMHANAELPGSLDTGSALVWAQEARELAARVGVEEALVEAARVTWIPRAAGRDHTGRVEAGKALGLEDVIRDAAANARGGQS